MKFNEKIFLSIIFGMVICAMYGSFLFIIGDLKNTAICLGLGAILWMVGTALFMTTDNFEEINNIKQCDCENKVVMYRTTNFTVYKCTQCGKISESPAHTTRLT